ncbi:hypothetical protein PRIPAC_88029 [Pristionchus pacificus]|uniref:Uncharacterized protein n=1 Tax=Pristionchus pacificus TaxID=54126 RepID=A0A2A6CTU7_PRIPA|nr:hypothetical protein PRIPAC_88029 [Pristionchus pacificus]|eukprot:PDM81530.1 hypothetical protein PRIPAC_35406 [Pristionchus pacificus]
MHPGIGEQLFWGGWGTRCREDGKTVVYRMCDDEPERDGIVVDVSEDEMIGTELAGVHRGRLFYSIVKEGLSEPVIRQLCDKLPDCQRTVSAYADDSLPYLYIENGQHLFTLNTSTLKFLPSLKIEINCVYSIAGVRNGIVTMRGITSYFDWYRMTARLPEEWATPVHSEYINAEIFAVFKD